MNHDHSPRSSSLSAPPVLSRESTSILPSHHSSRVSVKCRVHPGDSTSSRLRGSSPAILPENSVEGWGPQPSSWPPAEPGAIAMQMTVVTGLSRPP